mmetsp:Transcript_1666/g.4083  ORF Transcript_1666/g.4083 Transcript_1666/m.4083 type:complete len:324 (-) Transcript_1666:256-1227(-)
MVLRRDLFFVGMPPLPLLLLSIHDDVDRLDADPVNLVLAEREELFQAADAKLLVRGRSVVEERGGVRGGDAVAAGGRCGAALGLMPVAVAAPLCLVEVLDVLGDHLVGLAGDGVELGFGVEAGLPLRVAVGVDVLDVPHGGDLAGPLELHGLALLALRRVLLGRAGGERRGEERGRTHDRGRVLRRRLRRLGGALRRDGLVAAAVAAAFLVVVVVALSRLLVLAFLLVPLLGASAALAHGVVGSAASLVLFEPRPELAPRGRFLVAVAAARGGAAVAAESRQHALLQIGRRLRDCYAKAWHGGWLVVCSFGLPLRSSRHRCVC